MAEKNIHPIQNPLSRREFLDLVRAGLQVKQYPFVRQAALTWLGTYPGDLEMGLIYAQALAGEGHDQLSLQIAQGLTTADPEFIEAVNFASELILRLMQNPERPSFSPVSHPHQVKRDEARRGSYETGNDLLAHQFALTGKSINNEVSASWGAPLWIARQAMLRGDYTLAEQLVEESISQGVNHPLVGVLHLELLSKKPEGEKNARQLIAHSYNQRWPDTLQVMLRYADALLKIGRSDQTVALVHQAASRDVAGQVIRRMWGADHAYMALWPPSLQVRINIMVPGIVMAVLGWNRLPSGHPLQAGPVSWSGLNVSDIGKSQIPVSPTGSNSERSGLPQIDNLSGTSYSTIDFIGQITQDLQDNSSPADQLAQSAKNDFRRFEQELEKLAKHCKAPGVMRQDGRFPVYIIFSARSRLQSVYGLELTGLIEHEMNQLADALKSRPGWTGRVFFADDPADTQMVGLKAAKPEDAWSLKLLLADLDEALAKNGERIGALLIVGGSEIIPFHLLPNPVDDSDQEVRSDNPYAARDKNYFLPEWPVGRLPGGAGTDAGLILNALRRFAKMHKSYKRRKPWHKKMGAWFRSFGAFFHPAAQASFGYSAEIWQQAAGNVFRVIGRPSLMHISPPCGLMVSAGESEAKKAQGLKGVPAPVGKLAYYNLHGVADAVEWFGHRDLLSGSGGPDFPIALRPEDIGARSTKGCFPEVVFSEACYGMNIQDRTIEEAISLKFLEAGTLAVVGATCMSYGTVGNTTLLAADLLGHTFWRFLKSGMPAGEALRQAKIYLVSEMQKRQGYLDGEDQKTAISFILYGDPLAEPFHLTRVPKSIRFQSRSFDPIRTICDRMDTQKDDGPVPPEVMKGVQRAVAKYLPGMKDARLAYVCEHPKHSGSDAINTHAPIKHKSSRL